MYAFYFIFLPYCTAQDFQSNTEKEKWVGILALFPVLGRKQSLTIKFDVCL